MIHVRHPDGWEPPQPEETPEESLSSFDDIDSVLQQPQQAPAKGSPKKANKPTQKSRTGKKGQGKSTASESRLPINAPTDSRAADKPDRSNNSSAPVLPSDNWTSEGSRQRRKLIFMIASAVGAVAIVACIITAIVINSGNRDRVSEGGPQADQVNDESLGDKPEDKAANDPGSKTGSAASNKEQDSTPEGEYLDETPIVSQPISQEGAIGEAPEISGIEKDGGFSAPSIETNDPPEQTNGQQTPKENRLVPSLDRTPNPLSTEPAKPEEIKGIIEPQDNLGSLQALLNASDTTFQELQDAVSTNTQASMTKYFMEPARTGIISLERRLELSIDQLSYQKPTPFSQAVRLLSDLGGFPVTIDARQLALHQKEVDPRRKHQVEAQSILEALNSLGEQQGLKAVTTETGVILTLEDDGELVQSSLSFPSIPDLGLEEKQKFIAAIKGMIQPEIWTAEPAEGAPQISLVNDQISLKCNRTTERLIRSFVQKLEASYQLIRSPNDPEILDETKSRWSKTLPLQESATTMKAGGSRPIHAYLARLNLDTGMSVLVDWHHVTQQGWTPGTLVPGELSEPTVGDLIRELSVAMRLVPVAIDASTIVLTTEAQSKSWIDIEVYPISQALHQKINGNQIPKLLYDLIGTKVNDHFVRVVFEPKCRCLIVVAPQSIQRQVESVVAELDN